MLATGNWGKFQMSAELNFRGKFYQPSSKALYIILGISAETSIICGLTKINNPFYFADNHSNLGPKEEKVEESEEAEKAEEQQAEQQDEQKETAEEGEQVEEEQKQEQPESEQQPEAEREQTAVETEQKEEDTEKEGMFLEHTS